jgi:hypothetical protein
MEQLRVVLNMPAIFGLRAPVILVLAAVVADTGTPGSDAGGAGHLRGLLVAGQWNEALSLAKPAALWIEHANGSEGLIQTNTPTLLDWDVCVPRGGTNPGPALCPTIYRYPWLEFVQSSNGLTATLHLKVDSWPKTEWKIQLQRVDRMGAFVILHSKAEKLIENSGTIETVPHQEDLEATFQLSHEAEFHPSPGMLYQIGIETVWTEQGNPVRWGEAMPLALALPAAEQSRVFRAESLTLEKTGDSVRATVRAEVIDWPKSRWRLVLDLSGAQGKQLGRAEETVENVGEIISRPAWYRPSFQFVVPGNLQALEAAPRWTLRIESLPNAKNERTSTPDR